MLVQFKTYVIAVGVDAGDGGGAGAYERV